MQIIADQASDIEKLDALARVGPTTNAEIHCEGLLDSLNTLSPRHCRGNINAFTISGKNVIVLCRKRLNRLNSNTPLPDRVDVKQIATGVTIDKIRGDHLSVTLAEQMLNTEDIGGGMGLVLHIMLLNFRSCSLIAALRS